MVPKNKKDISWQSDGDVYLGHEVSTNEIYVGGRYYSSSAQIHLSIGEAIWLRRALSKAIGRRNKPPRRKRKP